MAKNKRLNKGDAVFSQTSPAEHSDISLIFSAHSGYCLQARNTNPWERVSTSNFVIYSAH